MVLRTTQHWEIWLSTHSSGAAIPCQSWELMAHKILPSTKEAALNNNGAGLGLLQQRIPMISRLQLIARQS
jgi:hypothetical protein